LYITKTKNLLKNSFNIIPKNHFLQNVSTLSQQLLNNGFDVLGNEGYNENLGNNFVEDLTILRDKLPPITITEPVEIINLPVENKSVFADQPDEVPLPELPEEQTLQEIDEEIQMCREEDRINKLRELAENQKLQNNTYILINSQFDNKIKKHPPKEIEERIYEDIPPNYPKILMINKPVNWEASSKI
jgi:hypothetical protein